MKTKPLPWNPDDPVKPDPRQLRLIPDPPPPPAPRGCGAPLGHGTCGSDPLGVGAIQLCRPCYQASQAPTAQATPTSNASEA